MHKIYKITSNPTVDFAAEELKKYLRMMMPDCGEITIESDEKATTDFRLGLMSDFGIDTSEADDIVLDDIIHIDVDGDGNGIIAGSNPRSVLLAVYRYLDINGCRWLFPGIDGEYIPIKNIEAVKYHKMADNRYRGQCNEGAENQQCMIETIDFTPKVGMNVYMLEFDNPSCYYDWYYSHECNDTNREPEPVTDETTLQWKRACESEIKKRGLQNHDMGHGWTVFPFGMKQWGENGNSGNILPEEMRPFMALVDGKRDIINNMPHNTNICMSNPSARRRVVDAAVDYATLNFNVDYLHIALADGRNKHCECDECRKKTPSDWFVIMLNEIDEEFTKNNLKTRLVFCCYEDTAWPATTERLKNPDRFLMNVCPIWRDYTEPVSPNIELMDIHPFELNKNTPVTDVREVMACAKGWQERNKMNMFVYDYHFWTHQCLDVGGISLAKVIHGDVLGFKSNGLLGMIEDGSQRSFFPNGLCFYVYARTLFDTSLSFDQIAEDYYSHAYGEDWKIVYEFVESVGKAFGHKYLEGKASADPTKNKYYDPAHAESLRSVKKLVDEFRPFYEAHKNMPMRAQTVSYRLLNYFLKYCEGLAPILVLKCSGLDDEAMQAYADFLNEFGKYEIEIERYYDQSLYGMTFALYNKFLRGALKAQKKALNV